MNGRSPAIVPATWQADQADNVLAQYLTAAWRRRWLIVFVTIGSAAVAAVWSFHQTPVYQSKATIVIDREGPGALERDKYYAQDTSPEYFQTHFELMKSHEVLKRTAQMLQLAQRPEFQRPPAKPAFVLPEILTGKAASGTVQYAADPEALALAQFSQQIEIMPIRGARLAHILVSSPDPQFAALAANTLASVYIQRTEDITANAKHRAAQWFTAHLDELRNRVESSQQSLYMFRSKHGLIEGRERQTVAAHKYAELNSELVRAEMKKAEAQTRYEQIKSVLHGQASGKGINWSNLDASIEVLSSPLIQALRGQEIRASGQVAELSEKYGPLHPKLGHARSELQDLREKLQQEIQKIFDSVQREYDIAVARERAIREAVNRNKKDKISLEQYEIEHGILEREAESNQHLYDIFLKVAKEADLSTGMRASNVYLADPAVPNFFPVKPKKKLNTILGLFVGLITGTAAALSLEARDGRLKKPTDVERLMPSIALLGVVPMLTQNDSSNGRFLLSQNSFGPGAESFRAIRTSILLSNADELGPPCVLITSPGESEGKTTLAVNLAMAMAQLEDERVILIDADMRKSRAHQIFEMQEAAGVPRKGLAQFLAGEASFHEVIHQTSIPSLFIIPSGKCPVNPSELLQSKRMSMLLGLCRDQGFQTILDAPPVLPVTDPVVLARQVNGVLLVVSAGSTTREACQLAVQRLTACGSNILGIVMQKARLTDIPYFSAYYKNAGDRNASPAG